LGLDEWLHHLRIRGHDRHSALADAFSTAQLFLAVLARAEQRGASDAHCLLELERAARRCAAGVRALLANGGTADILAATGPSRAGTKH